MAIKVLIGGIPKNLPDLEEACLIFILTKAIKPPRGPTIDVSKFTPGFMLQMDFVFFNDESIRGFTSNFVALCSATSYPFGFPSRRELPPLDILKFLVTTLSNYDNSTGLMNMENYQDLRNS